MKVVLKFPIYVVAEFSENIPRDKATRLLQEFFADHLSVDTTRSGIEKRRFTNQLEETFGCNVSLKYITEKQLLQKLITGK